MSSDTHISLAVRSTHVHRRHLSDVSFTNQNYLIRSPNTSSTYDTLTARKLAKYVQARDIERARKKGASSEEIRDALLNGSTGTIAR